MKRHVHIIESPSASDFYADMREGALLEAGLKLLRIHSKYRIAVNKDIFLNALSEVDCDDKSLGPPVLHLSMHGDADGLQLCDESYIPWDDLKPHLTTINAKLNGELLLCMSSCKGINGLKMALGLPNDPRPFNVIIGSPETIELSDLALGFLTFYNHLLSKNKKLNEALDAMKVTVGNPYFFMIHSSEAQQAHLGD